MRVPNFVRSHPFASSGSALALPRRRRGARLAIVGVSAIASIVGSAVLAPRADAAASTLFVATTGSDAGANNCQTVGTPCATLAYALTQATGGTGDTIMIAPGTYTMTAGSSNVVPSGAAFNGMTIESNGGTAANTIINAAGAINGLQVNANNVTVNNLTFENAGAAGIMVSPPSGATQPAAVTGELIENNVITNSDQCVLTPAAAGCVAAIGAGDYGESMWLLSVVTSTIQNNTVTGGLGGGMLISDELGPNHGNTVQGNNVSNNSSFGCGITLAGHNMAAAFSSGPNAGQPNPTAGGVYSNTIQNNISNGNGATGIGLFNFAYNNTIQGNATAGNAEPGIEVDSTFPGADLNGNSIIGNTVGINSISDGPGSNSPGQHTIHATQTVGVMVIAKAGPVTGTVIQNNTITGNYYGIWMSALASTTSLSGNTISVAQGGRAVFVSPLPGGGYWELGADGGVFSFGQAPFEGSTGGLKLNQPVVAMAPTPDGGGYWLVAKDGGIFGFGDANYYGSLPGLKVKVTNIVGIVPTFDGGGYWLVASDGGIFGFGDAKYLGSLPGLKVKVSNIVGITATPDGGGYWLVAKDGGIFSFGDATYFGSLPGLKVNVTNIVGIAATADGGGYWLVAKDGGIFSFGDATYFGSLPGLKVNVSNIGAMAATPDGSGYWLVGSDGGVFSFGDATYFGSLPGLGIHVSNILGLQSTP
jgi:parallel beta-helix repeat protein